MKKNNKPLIGLMTNYGGNQDYLSYKIACICGDNSCDINMIYEINEEDKEATLSFYSFYYLPIWKKGFNRIIYALKVLFFGKLELESHTLLTKEQSLQLSDIIKENMTKGKKNDKKRK